LGRTFNGHLRGRCALPSLFLGSVVESTVFPWPIEFPLLAYMLRGRRAVVLATLTVTLGSVVGVTLSLWAGYAAFGALESFIAERSTLAQQLDESQTRIGEIGAPAIVLAMMTPVPVQISSFAAGLLQIPVWVFVPAALLGRSIRYAVMGVLVFIWGEPILRWWSGRPRRLRQLARYGIYALFVSMLIWISIALI
jgi:membrane protein YqaA with SNARE-associated domain